MMFKTSLIFFFIIATVSHFPSCHFLPISTNKRWLLDDQTGRRVKLACVNWASHTGPMLAEGLDKKPLHFIVNLVADQGYSCVRLTWPTFLWTRAHYRRMTVAQSLASLNLSRATSAIAMHNPFILPMTLQQAFEAVVEGIASRGLMLVLDNHVSLPIWCCSGTDGNGFFNDEYFRPKEWARGLSTVAKRFRGEPLVVGIGMRNELRGSRQNSADWFKYIKYGARKIHKANPNLLTFASGLNFATNLSFLKDAMFTFSNHNKLVLEAHQYTWSHQMQSTSADETCAFRVKLFDDANGFVLHEETPFPIFVGEIGINQETPSSTEVEFLECFLSYMAEMDLDWAFWALQGSYYLRGGKTNVDETFGMVDYDWNGVRNAALQEKLSIVKRALQDPGSIVPISYVIIHPHSAGCVHVDVGGIYLQNCGATELAHWARWAHSGSQTPINLLGTELCLKATGEGLPVTLSGECAGGMSLWSSVSSSKLHLSVNDFNGNSLCLESRVGDGRLVTQPCVCVSGEPKCKSDPTLQWFRLVPTNT